MGGVGGGEEIRFAYYVHLGKQNSLFEIFFLKAALVYEFLLLTYLFVVVFQSLKGIRRIAISTASLIMILR